MCAVEVVADAIHGCGGHAFRFTLSLGLPLSE